MDIHSLYSNACRGDKNSEENLFLYLSARLKYLAQLQIWNKDDAEEIVQDSLMTVARKYKDIDIEISFSGWVYKILENNILNYMRKKGYKNKRFVEMLDGDDRPITSNPDLRIKILSCLRKICKASIRNARMLNLYYQGYSTDEICRKLSLTRNNSYSVLYRARSMLELCLEKGDIK